MAAEREQGEVRQDDCADDAALAERLSRQYQQEDADFQYAMRLSQAGAEDVGATEPAAWEPRGEDVFLHRAIKASLQGGAAFVARRSPVPRSPTSSSSGWITAGSDDVVEGLRGVDGASEEEASTSAVRACAADLQSCQQTLPCNSDRCGAQLCAGILTRHRSCRSLMRRERCVTLPRVLWLRLLKRKGCQLGCAMSPSARNKTSWHWTGTLCTC